MLSATKILSDITHYMKYSKYISELERRETFLETIERNKQMHKDKYPNLSKDIDYWYTFVENKNILPSMRSLQFGGEAIIKNQSRMFNCSYQPVNHYRVFAETMFLLLSGVGKGYSVQKHHIDQLPTIQTPKNSFFYTIDDSIEGWADSVKVLVMAYFGLGDLPLFDFSKIREKGSRIITSGGKAPGPEPLKKCLKEIQQVFIQSLIKRGESTKLESIECHSIQCHIADAVLSGGIRRAAMICLFDYFDLKMRKCKQGNWWETNPHFARANNSIVCHYDEITYDIYLELWKDVVDSGAGEPGFYWVNNKDVLTNPCAEASLEANSFCNLVDINANSIKNQDHFNEVCRVASSINTLQAGYTNFHYLDPIWQQVTERDALIGVGITGIGSGTLDNLDLYKASTIVKEQNLNIASEIGINQAKRSCMIKPSGTSSLVLGTSSGIHDWYDEYYYRRLRVNKREPIYQYLLNTLPELIEDDFYDPLNSSVMTFPQKAPDNAKITKNSTALDMLERTKRFNLEWIRNSHVGGDNYHNVSATIQVKKDEWDIVGQWIWDNRYNYHGLTVLPFEDHCYKQAPFESCTKEQYENLFKYISDINLSDIIEQDDFTNLTEQVACSGGICELI